MNQKPILEQGATSASNIYGLGVDENVIRFEPANVYYFYQDHEGSVTHVRAVTTGATIESYRYDAFGAPTIRNASGVVQTTSQINNRFMFTGREWAPANLGFYEYRARAYHPGLGRFMSEDPKGFDAGDYNLFRYCGNDPEDRVDPSGMIAGIFSPSGDWASIASNGYLDSGAQGAHGDGSSPKADQAGDGSDAGAAEHSTITTADVWRAAHGNGATVAYTRVDKGAPALDPVRVHEARTATDQSAKAAERANGLPHSVISYADKSGQHYGKPAPGIKTGDAGGRPTFKEVYRFNGIERAAGHIHQPGDSSFSPYDKALSQGRADGSSRIPIIVMKNYEGRREGVAYDAIYRGFRYEISSNEQVISAYRY